MDIRMMMPKKRLNSGTNAFYISDLSVTTFSSAQHRIHPNKPDTLGMLMKTDVSACAGIEAILGIG
jgi:hypothetical protein